jgi:hypothetical protein
MQSPSLPPSQANLEISNGLLKTRRLVVNTLLGYTTMTTGGGGGVPLLTLCSSALRRGEVGSGQVEEHPRLGSAHYEMELTGTQAATARRIPVVKHCKPI